MTVVRLQLLEIAGQERFGNNTRAYYKEAKAAIIVVDATRETTLIGTERWINDLKNKLEDANKPEFPIVIAVSKLDLISDTKGQKWLKLKSKIQALAKECNIQVFYTSAKDDLNLDPMLKELIKKCVANETKADNETDLGLLSNSLFASSENLVEAEKVHPPQTSAEHTRQHTSKDQPFFHKNNPCICSKLTKEALGNAPFSAENDPELQKAIDYFRFMRADDASSSFPSIAEREGIELDDFGVGYNN